MTRFAKLAAAAVVPDEEESDRPSWKEWLGTAAGLGALGLAGYHGYKNWDSISEALGNATKTLWQRFSPGTTGAGAATALLAPKAMSTLPGMRNSGLRSFSGMADAAGVAAAGNKAAHPLGDVMDRWQKAIDATAGKNKPARYSLVNDLRTLGDTEAAPQNKLRAVLHGIPANGIVADKSTGELVNERLAYNPSKLSRASAYVRGALWSPDKGLGVNEMSTLARRFQEMAKNPGMANNKQVYGLTPQQHLNFVNEALRTSGPKSSKLTRGLGGAVAGMAAGEVPNMLSNMSE